MLKIKGQYNLFQLPKSGEAICITTNGIIKSNGSAVMGAGIAKQANQLYHVSPLLGRYLKQYGNRPFNLGKITNQNGYHHLLTFPTKHHWKDNSDITLICKSAELLVPMIDKFGITRCYIPPVGCGCGNLNWETMVEPWLSQILDDRFVAVLPHSGHL